MLHQIGNVLIFWATIVGVASVVLHAQVSWWRYEMGRHLMAYMGAVALVLTLSCIRIVFGDSPWFQILRLVVFVAIPLAMTQRLLIQIRARRESRKRNQNMTNQQPTIGQIVHYKLSEFDVSRIEVEHQGVIGVRMNAPSVGDVCPAVIVRVFSETVVNLRVYLDGVVDYWATSREPAAEDQQVTAGRWFWPPRV